MPQSHSLQQQRFELKYIIPESLALSIRDYVQPYLAPDNYAAGSADFSYPIHNIYLDSDNLEIYHQSINGDKNRYKLRMRFYDDNPDSPVFFEIKRRMNDVILKSRCGVRRTAIPLVFAGHIPDMSETLSGNARDINTLERFCVLMNELGAKPKSHIGYMREAWVSVQDNSVRVTMDRSVRSEPQFTTAPSTTMVDPTIVFGNDVVLELKFTDRFPSWLRELVRAFGLVRSGGAKYVGGIVNRGEEHFRNPLVRETFPVDQSATGNP